MIAMQPINNDNMQDMISWLLSAAQKNPKGKCRSGDRVVEYDFDKYNESFAQAGPINSQRTLEANIIVSRADPCSPPKVRAPKAAKPIATPA